MLVESSLSCYYVNARSIIKNWDEFVMDISHFKPDVIGVTESWAHEGIKDEEISLEGYNLYRYRDPGRVDTRGGGVLLYLKDYLRSVPFNSFNHIRPQESVWRKIISTTKPIVVGVMYRSTAEQLRVLPDILNEMSKCHAVLVGDFNLRSIRWLEQECSAEDRQIMEAIEENFLTQHVDKPTREENILDLILTTEPNMVEELQVRENLGTSDHNIILWRLVCEVKVKGNDCQIYDYNKGDYDGLREYLSQLQWNKLLENKKVEEMWEIFKAKLLEGVSEYIPVKSRTQKTKPKWMTRQANKARHKKYKLWKRYQQTKSREDYEVYKKALNEATKKIREAKQNFEMKLAKNIKQDTKSFYAYARSKYKTKERVGPLTDEKNELVDDDANAARMLNSYFTSVFTNEPNEDVPEIRQVFNGREDEKLDNIEIRREDVYSRLIGLRVDKAPGPDNIVPRVLKETAREIVDPIVQIFNGSINTGEIPRDWRRANVTPLHKKG